MPYSPDRWKQLLAGFRNCDAKVVLQNLEITPFIPDKNLPWRFVASSRIRVALQQFEEEHLCPWETGGGAGEDVGKVGRIGGDGHGQQRRHRLRRIITVEVECLGVSYFTVS
jgi:hypothetical protein